MLATLLEGVNEFLKVKLKKKLILFYILVLVCVKVGKCDTYSGRQYFS